MPDAGGWTSHSPHFVLTAAGFPEVGDGRQLCMDGLAVEPAVVQVHDRLLRILLTAELHSRTLRYSAVAAPPNGDPSGPPTFT